MIVALTGFMGCGKSSVGRVLADMLASAGHGGISVGFVDLDMVIGEQEGMTIPEIFARKGESGFRKAELHALADVLARHSDDGGLLVLALGGGTVTVPEAAELVKESTTCFYLKASLEELGRRISGSGTAHRPMLSGNSVGALLSDRITCYEDVCDHMVETDGLNVQEVAERIAEYLACQSGSHPQ